jgi:hypothetical protein
VLVDAVDFEFAHFVSFVPRLNYAHGRAFINPSANATVPFRLYSAHDE